MSEGFRTDRRRLLGLLLSAAATALLAGRGAAGPLDQGIGGTGVAPPTDESDRGIGGTGVIGTIRKFGSIVVNDLRIAYPADAKVRIDGRPASVRDLKIGQVVRVAARGPDSSLSTRAIDVTSEVVGPVEKTGTDQLTVLGQSVSTTGLDTKSLKAGDIVAVSGLRRNDGTIAASLVEPRPGAVSRVAGPLSRGPDGTMRIGGLTVADVAPDLVGHRVVLVGRSEGARFIASRSATETSFLPRTVRTLSIESYVERRGDRLQLGSGFAVDHRTGVGVPEGRSVRAILRTSFGPNGRLTVDSFRATTTPVGGGRGPGGAGPGRDGSGRGGPGHGGLGHGGPGHGGPGQPGRMGRGAGDRPFRDGRPSMHSGRDFGGPGERGGPGGDFRGPRGGGRPGRFGGPGGFRGGPGGFRGGGGQRGFGGGGFGGRRR